MRAVISNGISLAEMSRELKKKSVDGMYDLEDDAPEHIDDVGEKCFKRVKRLFTKMKASENVSSSLKAKLQLSVCTIRPEDLVVADSEGEYIPTRETTAGSSNTTTTFPSLPNSTNKRKLEEDILFQKKERELQFLARMQADLEKKAERDMQKLVDIQIQREKQAMEAGLDKKAKSHKMMLVDFEIQRERQVKKAESNKMKLVDIQIQREKQVKKVESNKMKLVDVQIQREKQLFALLNAGQDEKKSKRGPPQSQPGPSH